MPCTQMKINVDYIGKKKNYYNSYVIFKFAEFYEFKSKQLAYGWFEFIIDVGSSLGVWLGRY